MLASAARLAYRSRVPSPLDPTPAARRVLDSAEFRTIAACCRWPDDTARRTAIAAAAREVTDWNWLWRMTERHRVRGLVQHGLAAAQVDIPQEVATRLSSAARRNAIDNLQMAAEVARISVALEASGIRHLFFKGITLAERVYGSQALKEGRDIDLLVDGDQVEAAMETLKGTGFALHEPAPRLGRRQWAYVRRFHKDVTLVHPATGFHLEVHWNLTSYGDLLPLSEFDLRAVDRLPLDRATIPMLSVAQLLFYLPVHGASDLWHRLKWLADFAALVAQTDPEAVITAIRRAKKLGIDRPVAEGLWLAHELLGLSLSDDVVAEIVSLRPRIGRRMALEAIAARHGEETVVARFPFTALVALGRMRLRRGIRHKLYVLKPYLFGSADGIELPLPLLLYPLYPLVRLPLWLRRNMRRKMA